jgi:hypothetical protein
VWKDQCDDQEVAVKALRVYTRSDFVRIRKVGWSRLVMCILTVLCAEVL